MEKLICFLRYYIKDKESCNAFEKIVKKSIIAMKNPNVSISFLINTNINLKREIKDQLKEITKDILYHNISYSVTIAYGAGHAFFDILEESISTTSLAKKEKAIFLLDADQYDIASPIVIKKLFQLRKAVIENNALMGTAQRDHIILAETQELEHAREIEELFHAYFIRNKILNCSTKLEKKLLSIPKGYMELGDPVPGCYCINIRHTKFFKFLSKIQIDLLTADLSKYSGDPYTIMQAAQFGKIVSKYVPILKNPPSEFSLKTIKDKHKNLALTSLGKKYAKTILSEKAFNQLKKYYSVKEITLVRNIILKGLSSII